MHQASHPCRVLLVEDDARSAELAQTILELFQCQVTPVTSGDAAVGAVRGQGYDIVLMDVHLPVMNGLEATRQIRAYEADQRLPPVYITALTALALPNDIDRCLEAGMDEVMTKPFMIERLERALLNAYRVRRWPRAASVPQVAMPASTNKAAVDGSGTLDAHCAC